MVGGTAGRLRGKQLEWLKNPALPAQDSRQGGPLYYAKYFRDRDRYMDERFVREELKRSADKLAESPESNSSSQSSSEVSRRRSSVWKTYRRLSVHEIEKISAFDKLSRILANEVHLTKTNPETNKDRMTLLEERLVFLARAKEAGAAESPSIVSKKDLENAVKCLHHFGVAQHIGTGKSIETVLSLLDANPTSVKKLKPENLAYILQAMSRLGYRDKRLMDLLSLLSLCWGVLGSRDPLMLIRGANAVARLDLTRSAGSGLKEALAQLLGSKSLTQSQLEKIKAVTVCDIFDDYMVLDYLVLSEQFNVRYKRHAAMVYLKRVRKNPELLKKLPATAKEWVEDVMKSGDSSSTIIPNDESSFTSPLHEDVARILKEVAVSDISAVGLSCGPFKLDVFIPSLNVVIETCSEFQFYHRTTKLTTEAALRHELIRSLGFDVLPVTYFKWNALPNDKAKRDWLKENLAQFKEPRK